MTELDTVPEIDLEEEEPGKEENGSIERPSSIHQLQALIKRALPKTGEEKRIKDPTKEAIELYKEFVELVMTLNVSFFVNLMECEPDLYVIVMSEHDLVGGSKMVDGKTAGELVELESHSWVQRTYSWQSENKNATWVVFTELASYKYYIEVPQKIAVLGKKKEKEKWAPIVWVSGSDGQCRSQDNTMRRSHHRQLPTKSDIIQAQLIYGVNVASKLLESNKLLAQKVKEKTSSYEELKDETANTIKYMVAEGLERGFLIGKAPRSGLWAGVVHLFSNRAVQLIVYLVAVIGLFTLISYIVSALTGAPFVWGDPTGSYTGDPTSTPDAVTGPITEGTP